MVAPLVAAAGISALGSVAGGVAGGKGAKKAAKAAAQAQREQIAAIERNRQQQFNLNAPTIAYGNAADDRIAGLLRLGGDPAAAEAAYGAYKDSTGYQGRLDEGLGAVNTNRFAGGSGQSGGTLKALLKYGQEYASGEFGKYLGQVGGVSASGANARGLVAGVGGQSTNQFVNSSQVGTGYQIGAINQGTQNTQNMIQNLVNSGIYALGSSYGPRARMGY